MAEALPSPTTSPTNSTNPTNPATDIAIIPATIAPPRKKLHAVLSELLCRKTPETVKAAETRLKELGLRYYNDFALVIISWNSLSTPVPDIVLKPTTNADKDTIFRFVKTNTNAPDVHIQVYATREEVSSYIARFQRRVSMSGTTFLDDVGRIWLTHSAIKVHDVTIKTLKDAEILSILTSELSKSYQIGDAISITLLLHANTPVDQIRDAMREKMGTTKANEALAMLQPTIDREHFADYVDTHRAVCVYDDSLPLQVIDIPNGQGLFSDLLPRRFIINPFIAIVTDTLEKPLVSLDSIEEDRLQTLPQDSPLKTSIRRYYILRKNSREVKSRDVLNEYISFGCYATKLLLFDTKKEAEMAITKLCQSRGKYIKPLKE